MSLPRSWRRARRRPPRRRLPSSPPPQTPTSSIKRGRALTPFTAASQLRLLFPLRLPATPRGGPRSSPPAAAEECLDAG
eukprot:scaffold5244_cov122-Isochrysis_galbana.AAC.2